MKEACYKAHASLRSIILLHTDALASMPPSNMKLLEKCTNVMSWIEKIEREIMIKLDKNTIIMNTVNNIYNQEEEELFGFCVRNEVMNDMESFKKTGHYILYTFKKFPEQAEILEEMLIAICGWGIGSLQRIMEEQREHYDSL